MVKRLLVFVSFVLVTLFIYRNGLHIPYYFDDFEHVFTDPHRALSESFSKANDFAHFYRPIEKAVLSLIQIYFGWDTFPIRLFHLLLHAAGAYLVYFTLSRWDMGSFASITGALFVIVSQLSGYAILSNDTASQIGGALFSALSLWFVYLYLSRQEGSMRRLDYITSIIFFLLALFAKETSAGLTIAITFLIVGVRKDGASLLKRVAHILLLLIPYALVFAIYWFVRLHAGGAMPSVNGFGQTFRFDETILRNAGLLFLQAGLPVSSVSVARALQYKEYVQIGVLAVLACAFSFFFIYGLFRSARRSLIKGLSVLLFTSTIPILFLRSMSELYPYTMVFILGALFGIAVEYYWNSVCTKGRVSAFMFTGFLILVGISNMLGVDEKALMMKSQGQRAQALMPQLVSIARSSSPNTILYLVSPQDSGFYYSQYSMQGFRVLATSDSLVHFQSARSDIVLSIGDSNDCAREAILAPGIGYSYDSGSLTMGERFGFGKK